MKIARIYLRVSTDGQDLQRQECIIAEAQAADHYIADVYREKASGARADRPELPRMIDDMQPGELVIAEKTRSHQSMAFSIRRTAGVNYPRQM